MDWDTTATKNLPQYSYTSSGTTTLKNVNTPQHSWFCNFHTGSILQDSQVRKVLSWPRSGIRAGCGERRRSLALEAHELALRLASIRGWLARLWRRLSTRSLAPPPSRSTSCTPSPATLALWATLESPPLARFQGSPGCGGCHKGAHRDGVRSGRVRRDPWPGPRPRRGGEARRRAAPKCWPLRPTLRLLGRLNCTLRRRTSLVLAR